MGDFSIGVAAWVDKTGKGMDTTLRALLRELLKRIVRRSPVLTGRFRGNWQVTINSIPRTSLDEYDPVGNATIAEGNTVIRNAKMGDITYITNNLTYALRLEYGWSRAAPHGVVRITAAEFKDILKTLPLA